MSDYRDNSDDEIDKFEYPIITFSSLIEEVRRLREALKNIIDYGKLLQPSPLHPITFTACVIAEKALSPPSNLSKVAEAKEELIKIARMIALEYGHSELVKAVYNLDAAEKKAGE